MPRLPVDQRDVRTFAHHALINREHRFVFFSVPKVACTQWIQLMMRIGGAEDWQDDPHGREDRPFLSALSPAECTDIINDPTWTKAVFLRDPVERFLSAYLDKIVRVPGARRYYFDTEGEVPLEQFISFALEPDRHSSPHRGLGPATDAHWRPQSLLGGIGKFIDSFQFVGDFRFLQVHTRVLLERLGLWEEFGAGGWGPSGEEPMFVVNDAENRTDAGHLMAEYFSQEDLLRMRDAYREDYAMIARVRPDQRPWTL